MEDSMVPYDMIPHDMIPHDKASNVGPSQIDIAYQRLGAPDAPAVLLVMGIAAQSIHWPDAFCQALVDDGLQVIRFDNRDVGLYPIPDLAPVSLVIGHGIGVYKS